MSEIVPVFKSATVFVGETLATIISVGVALDVGAILQQEPSEGFDLQESTRLEFEQ